MQPTNGFPELAADPIAPNRLAQMLGCDEAIAVVRQVIGCIAEDEGRMFFDPSLLPQALESTALLEPQPPLHEPFRNSSS